MKIQTAILAAAAGFIAAQSNFLSFIGTTTEIDRQISDLDKQRKRKIKELGSRMKANTQDLFGAKQERTHLFGEMDIDTSRANIESIIAPLDAEIARLRRQRMILLQESKGDPQQAALFGIGKSKHAAYLDREPGTLEDAIAMYFVQGGRVNKQDFKNVTGYGEKDLQAYLWAISNSAPAASDIIYSILEYNLGSQADAILAERVFWDMLLDGKQKMIDALRNAYEGEQGELQQPYWMDAPEQPEYVEEYDSNNDTWTPPAGDDAYAVTYTDRRTGQRYVLQNETGEKHFMQEVQRGLANNPMRDENISNPRLKKVL